MQAAAARHHVPFLWDDDEVSVGFGKTAITWPADQLPEPESVDWQAIGSIPLGIVTGTNGKSTTVRLSAEILAAAGLSAGITSTDYIRVGEEILDRGDYSGPGGARTLLRHPRSEAVVLEVARGGLLRRGIGVEHADAALITNVAEDHMGEYGINTVAEMAEAKFIVRRALVTDAPLILNADDPESVRMAATLQQQDYLVWAGCHSPGVTETPGRTRVRRPTCRMVGWFWLTKAKPGKLSRPKISPSPLAVWHDTTSAMRWVPWPCVPILGADDAGAGRGSQVLQW